MSELQKTKPRFRNHCGYRLIVRTVVAAPPLSLKRNDKEKTSHFRSPSTDHNVKQCERFDEDENSKECREEVLVLIVSNSFDPDFDHLNGQNQVNQRKESNNHHVEPMDTLI